MNEQQLLAVRSAVAIDGVKTAFHTLAADVTEPLRIERHVRAHPLVSMSLAALTGFIGTLFLPKRRSSSGPTQKPPGMVTRVVAKASRLARRTLESAVLSSLSASTESGEAPHTTAAEADVAASA